MVLRHYHLPLLTEIVYHGHILLAGFTRNLIYNSSLFAELN